MTNEQLSQTPSQAGGQSDIVGMIKKMQQQLDSLEKKIDALCQQSRPKPSEDYRANSFEKRFSKPFRSFDRSHHHGNKEHGYHPRERGFGQGGGHSPERRDDNNRGDFRHKKKPFFHKRKE